jgi:hypothetical protein
MSDPREGARLALEAVRDEMRNDNGDAPLTGFELYQLLGRAVCGERLNPAACSFEDTERHDECEGLDDCALARLSTPEAEKACRGWKCSLTSMVECGPHGQITCEGYDHPCANCHRPYSECMASRTQPEPAVSSEAFVREQRNEEWPTPEPAKEAEPVMPATHEFVPGGYERKTIFGTTEHEDCAEDCTHVAVPGATACICAREGCGRSALDPVHAKGEAQCTTTTSATSAATTFSTSRSSTSATAADSTPTPSSETTTTDAAQPAPAPMPEKAKPVAFVLTNFDRNVKPSVPHVLASDYDALWLACEEARREVERLKAHCAANEESLRIASATVAKVNQDFRDHLVHSADKIKAESERADREAGFVADLREDLNDARSGWESATAEVGRLQARLAAMAAAEAGEKAWDATWTLERGDYEDGDESFDVIALRASDGAIIVEEPVGVTEEPGPFAALLGSASSVRLGVRVLPDGEG